MIKLNMKAHSYEMTGTKEEILVELTMGLHKLYQNGALSIEDMYKTIELATKPYDEVKKEALDIAANQIAKDIEAGDEDAIRFVNMLDGLADLLERLTKG